jgi:hypothetical protein
MLLAVPRPFAPDSKVSIRTMIVSRTVPPQSRVGKSPIVVPQGVDVQVAGSSVTVKVRGRTVADITCKIISASLLGRP